MCRAAEDDDFFFFIRSRSGSDVAVSNWPEPCSQNLKSTILICSDSHDDDDDSAGCVVAVLWLSEVVCVCFFFLLCPSLMRRWIFVFVFFFFPPSSSRPPRAFISPRPAATPRWESCLGSIKQLIGRPRGFPVVALASHLPGDSDSPADTMSLGGSEFNTEALFLLQFTSLPLPSLSLDPGGGGWGLSPAPPQPPTPPPPGA